MKSLTPKQVSRLEEIKKEYIDKALTYQPFDDERIKICVEFAYSTINLPMPRVHKVVSPFDAQMLANKMNGTTNKFYSFGTYLTIYWQSFYAYYDTFAEFGLITPEDYPNYFLLREFVDSGIFSTIEFDTDIIICEKPVICKMVNNRMHSLGGPAIQWRNGYGQYYINGRNIPEEVFEACLNGTYTREMYLNETNDEVRSAAYMILGDKKIMDLLGASEIDTCMITHHNGELENISLFRTKEKLNKYKGTYYAWLKRICPSTGTVYLTPTNPEFNSALDAAKFHRPSFVPKNLDYKWHQRS